MHFGSLLGSPPEQTHVYMSHSTQWQPEAQLAYVLAFLAFNFALVVVTVCFLRAAIRRCIARRLSVRGEIEAAFCFKASNSASDLLPPNGDCHQTHHYAIMPSLSSHTCPTLSPLHNVQPCPSCRPGSVTHHIRRVNAAHTQTHERDLDDGAWEYLHG